MPFSTAGITLADCDSMYSTKEIYNGESFYKNPINNQMISENHIVFKQLNNHCQQLGNKNYIEYMVLKWINNPLLDPIDKKKIQPIINSESTYAKLYGMAYNYYKEKNLIIMEIMEKLPRYHLIFNDNIDILFYSQVKDDPDNSLYFPYDNSLQYHKYIYDIILQFNISKQHEKQVMKCLCNVFVDCLQEYIMYAIYILYTDINEMPQYVQEINKYFEKIELLSDFIKDVELYRVFYKLIQKRKTMLDEIEYYLMQDEYLNYMYSSYAIRGIIDTIINNILSSPNIFNKLLDYYYEVYNTYNYQNDITNAPFHNLNSNPITPIEDPLISILEKIGINNIDLASLTIPDRLFKDDAEYNRYLTRYQNLKAKYAKKVDEWQKYSNNRSALNLSVTTPPKKPVMQLPNGTLLNVVNQVFPYYMKDQQYKTIVKTYNDNKHIINMYKSMIHKGILDLLSESNLSSSSIENYLNASELINKDRDYFIQNVLKSGDTIDPEKCVQNTDLISTDQIDFDDKDYPLAKLQLMFKLVSNVDGKKFTYCFYAPNFYNYIVNMINQRNTIKNPATNKILTKAETDQAIDDLMKIMQVIVPNIERPQFILPPYDENLVISHDEIMHDSFLYYNIIICRNIGNMALTVLNLCTIPGDLDTEHTRTTAATSSTFLTKIYDLFNNGSLLYTYLPPYHILDNDGYHLFIKSNIHFNNYNTIDKWTQHSRKEQIRLFLHYFEEISNI
jgi:hypothetical protein